MNQKVAVKLLHSVGFRAAVVNNGKEALDLFVEKADAGESFGLILMDLQMPVMDGLQATREIFGTCWRGPGWPGRTSSRSLRTWLNRWWKSARHARWTGLSQSQSSARS